MNNTTSQVSKITHPLDILIGHGNEDGSASGDAQFVDFTFTDLGVILLQFKSHRENLLGEYVLLILYIYICIFVSKNIVS